VNKGVRSYNFHFELRVNGTAKASSYTSLAVSPECGSYLDFTYRGIQPIFLSALLPLNTGDQVGVYPISGVLYEADPVYVTRFSCILICGE